MTVLVNGVKKDHVSALNRGMLYGHSVFETIPVVSGTPALLNNHLIRLADGCEKLGLPFSSELITKEVECLIDQSEADKDYIIRITVFMDEGGRGYLSPDQATATRVISSHSAPQHPQEYWSKGINLGVSDVTLGAQPLLAGVKHGNRLEQVLARSRWQTDWQEAILCDVSGNVIEGTQSNIIVIKNGKANTPILDHCGVDGVMKNWVLLRLKELGVSSHSVRLSLQDIIEADEVLMTNSVIGVWPVKHFKNRVFSDSTTARQLIQLIHEHEIIPHN